MTCQARSISWLCYPGSHRAETLLMIGICRSKPSLDPCPGSLFQVHFDREADLAYAVAGGSGGITPVDMVVVVAVGKPRGAEYARNRSGSGAHRSGWSRPPIDRSAIQPSDSR